MDATCYKGAAAIADFASAVFERLGAMRQQEADPRREPLGSRRAGKRSFSTWQKA